MKDKEQLSQVYFFWLDSATKAYKQYAHKMFKEIGVDVTDDQWMVIKRIDEQPSINQKTLSNDIQKDPASVTRILDNLVKKGYVIREMGKDRRTFNLNLTASGKSIVKKVLPVAVKGRAKGLEGINETDSKMLIKILKKISSNFS